MCLGDRVKWWMEVLNSTIKQGPFTNRNARRGQRYRIAFLFKSYHRQQQGVKAKGQTSIA